MKFSVLPISVLIISALISACQAAPTATPTPAPKAAATTAPAATSTTAPKPTTPATTGAIAPGPEKFTPSPELVAAAEKEGKMVYYTGDSGDMVPKYFVAFNERFPKIDVSETLVEQESKLYAKITAEYQAGQAIVDVNFMDIEPMTIDFQKKGLLMKYDSPEYKYFDPKFLSKPSGFYGPAWVQLVGVAWNTGSVSDADAPKTWEDMLNPKYKGKISSYGSSSSSPFAQWYLLGKLLGMDFWEKMSQQNLRAYESSAQILDALVTGETPIALQFNDFRLKDVVQKKLPVKALWPEKGVPTFVSVQAIMAKAPHPNAAKLFHDWFMSREGQTAVAFKTAGRMSVRTDVERAATSPDVSKLNLLAPSDPDDYTAAYNNFQPAWNKIIGIK